MIKCRDTYNFSHKYYNLYSKLRRDEENELNKDRIINEQEGAKAFDEMKKMSVFIRSIIL